MRRFSIGFSFLILVLFSCEDPIVPDVQEDNFDRTAMMEEWVDTYIVPGYEAYVTSCSRLKLALSEFLATSDATQFELLKSAYLNAYQAWQKISVFEIGEAEKIGLRSYTNTYPTDTAKINEHLSLGEYNLDLPSTRAAQGFPALDYLLFEKINVDKPELFLAQENNTRYLVDLVERLENQSTLVKDSWDAQRRTEFSTDRESVNRMVNDFLFYYEKFLRAGKVAIPAGVFSGDILPFHVEAPFSGEYNRDLLLFALDATQNFFNSEDGLVAYLEFMDKLEIAEEINVHFNTARQLIQQLNPNLSQQILENNIKMLQVYDELQKAVILLKVDMLQALSIQVDYVDADGD